MLRATADIAASVNGLVEGLV